RRAGLAGVPGPPREHLEALGLVEQAERLAAVRGDLAGHQRHRALVHRDAASRYASTVARPQALGPNRAAAVWRAAAASSSHRTPSPSSDAISSASVGGSRGGTSSMPGPAAAISSGPPSPAPPIAGTPHDIAST